MLLAKTLRSTTFGLALIWIAIFGATVIALLGYVYWSTTSYVRSRSDQAITTELGVLQEAYVSGGRDGLITTIAQRIAGKSFDGGVYLFADPSYARLAGNLAAWPSSLKDANGWSNFDVPDWKPDSADRPLLRAMVETLPDGSHLLVGKDIEDLNAFAQKIDTALVLALLLIFVLAGAASVSVTRRTVGRIEAINTTSRTIMRSGLSERIPLRGTRDEWDELATNLNSMLDRIEALMAEVKQFTDNVAHDLRTPIARVRTRLEKAYNTLGDGDSHQLIGDTMAELDGVLRMFASLTRISQIEASDRTAAFHTIDLALIAREVVELFDAAAEENGVQLEVDGDRLVPATGDRDLLFDALSNLVDNAIKHGRAGGRVIVEVRPSDGGAEISVADDGPGIAAEELPHVFKRFYRLERSRQTPGNGLGLTLVAAVARLHGAQITMHDNAPGLKFRLCFPAPQQAGGEPRNVPRKRGGSLS